MSNDTNQVEMVTAFKQEAFWVEGRHDYVPGVYGLEQFLKIVERLQMCV